MMCRSGDKGSNGNVGFWVRHADEYDWLRSLLNVRTFTVLLGDDYKELYEIERFELPNLWAVHFLVRGILEGGISSSYKLDALAKSFGEFLSAFSLSPVSEGDADYFYRSKTCRYSYEIPRARNDLMGPTGRLHYDPAFNVEEGTSISCIVCYGLSMSGSPESTPCGRWSNHKSPKGPQLNQISPHTGCNSNFCAC